MQLEEQEKDLQAREAAASATKVKSVSERLMKFNASMTQKTVTKLKKVCSLLGFVVVVLVRCTL